MNSSCLLAAITILCSGCTLTESLGGGDLSTDVDATPHAAVLGQPRWAIKLGGPGDDELTGMVVDANGDVFVTGSVRDGANLGDGPIDIPETRPDLLLLAGFVSKRSGHDGSRIWNRMLISSYSAQVSGVALMPDAGVVVTGDFSGRVDFGGTVRSTRPIDETSCFIARYGSDGQLLWVQTRDAAELPCFTDLATEPGGRIFATTYQRDAIGNYRAGIEAFSRDGDPIWSHALGDIGLDEVAIAPNGDVLLGGYFQAPASFGGEPLEPCGWSCLGLARFTPDGTHLWSKGLTVAHAQLSLAFSGDTILVGTSVDAPNPRGSTILVPWATLIALSSTGDQLWSRQPADSTETYATTVLTTGTIVTTGRILRNEGADFGTGLVDGGMSLVAYDPDGTTAEARSYRGDGPANSFGHHIAPTPAGGFAYAGVTSGTIDMGLGPMAPLVPPGPGVFDIASIDIVVSLVDPLAP